MNHTFEILGFQQIIEQLQTYANTAQAKEEIKQLEPYLSESELRKNMRDTTQARLMLDKIGTPPIPIMEHVAEYVDQAVKGELLSPEDIAGIGTFLSAVNRLKGYLERGKEHQIAIAFYSDNLVPINDVAEEIERSIRDGRIDDYASGTLRDIRREILLLEEKCKNKAENILRVNQSYMTEAFVVNRNGRICVPVKKEYKTKIQGSVIDKSTTGNTLFIEPAAVAKLQEELELYRIEEDCEERRILYSLMNMIAEQEAIIRENIRMIVKLDFIFAKGKLSAEMAGIEPEINTDRVIMLQGARHPMLKKEECVPLDVIIGEENTGMIITGPNTGGKTVAIKTIGLMSLMACAGLHIPCMKANITINNQVLCDIGDGQNIADNLSTFSAHIKNVISILKVVTAESLVILDELGSGTDPAEGMGIAIAILERLRQSNCIFLATTHYPEVKEYATGHVEILNARMAFDRESLKPLYRLEVGKAGESCALYIAKRLGFPNEMLRMAAKAAYQSSEDKFDSLVKELILEQQDTDLEKIAVPGIKKYIPVKKDLAKEITFARGDSVTVSPGNQIGIVVSGADKEGNVLVQVKKEKKLINHKRLQLKVAATELYPEDYDFTIIFDTVENRKARHKMGKKYQGDLMIFTEE